MKEVTGYCVKCKAKDSVIKDAEVVTMENGRKAVKGVHADCGTGMYKMLSNEQAAELEG